MTALNNKRIAKNTSLLYLRMILVMGVSFYTSRVVLQTLGVEDYGIYSVVGGIITMFSFLNGSMVVSTQRYITFELGKGNSEKVAKVFSAAVQIHALISLMIVILGETIGLWFLLYEMNIPADRMSAAMWVYQCSIITSVINIMSVPYNADIIAHERMSAFAYISIFEVLAKLAVVYLLYISPWDRLIVYALLLLLIQIIIRFSYVFYCHRHFEESKYRHCYDRNLLKEMTNFAGWSFIGNFSGVLGNQGVNLMLNVFFGPVINAARGIAVQVQSVIHQFVSNFQLAINPQITKNYALGNIAETKSLMSRSARFSFFLLFILALPIFLEMDMLLSLWLVEVPAYTVIFSRIMLAISLISSVANPYTIVNQATGKVKKYQIVVGGSLLLTLPISFIVLKWGMPVYSIFLVQLFVECIAQLLRILLIRRNLSFSIKENYTNIYRPIALVAITSIPLPFLVHGMVINSWLRLITVVFVSIMSTMFSIYVFGLQRNEREFIKEKLISVLKGKKK